MPLMGRNWQWPVLSQLRKRSGLKEAAVNARKTVTRYGVNLKVLTCFRLLSLHSDEERYQTVLGSLCLL